MPESRCSRTIVAMHPTPLRQLARLCSIPFSLCLLCAVSLAAETGQHPQTMRKPIEVTVSYQLYLPAEGPGRRWVRGRA